MSSRFPQRPQAPRGPVAPVHRGPQALPPGGAFAAPFGAGAYGYSAPNAALLIDFDNVTMGIQKDMQAELRNLLSSDIIKGKVSVQRAYADWRRYPSYVVPLTENSIDLIFAPAYGSAKKNATDIRLAIDAMELVFTRPEIGTFILLSGDSDFSSLVIKLKEYGKYVIGVGIRESASDLLVQNCDEYYSYNALAGLVSTRDEEQQQKRWDPFELVAEAVQRMVRDGDTMRADRLKQVMQDIDGSFDEKELGMAKFSRFVTEAERRGLLAVTRLDSGQYEIAPGPKLAPARDLPRDAGRDLGRDARRDDGRRDAAVAAQEAGIDAEADAEAERADRSRRRGRGRGRPRDAERDVARYPRVDAEPGAEPDTDDGKLTLDEVLQAPAAPAIGTSGERLTRAEAFDLVRRAAEALAPDAAATAAPAAVRERAFALLGRDSESLTERMFDRILRDAADAGLVELRAEGDALRVGRAAQASSVADQLNRAAAATQAPTGPADAPQPRGLGNRGLPRLRGGRGGGAAPPPELLLLGAVGPVAGAQPPEAEVATSAGEAVSVTLADTTTGSAAPGDAVREAGTPDRTDAGAASESPEPAAPAAPTFVVPPLARGNLRGRGRGGRGGMIPAELLLTGAVAPAVTAGTPAAAAAAVTPTPTPAETPAPAITGAGPTVPDVAFDIAADAGAPTDRAPAAVAEPAPEAPSDDATPEPSASRRGRGRGRGGRKSATKQAGATPPAAEAAPVAAPAPSAPTPSTPAAAPQPAAPQPAAKQPAAAQRGVKQPRGRQPASKPPASKQSASKQPAAKQAAAKQAPAKQAAAKQPAPSKQPAAKQAAAKQAAPAPADAARPERRRRPRPAKRAE
jgi:uncharacterized protein (TIGR00288 family)